MCQSVRTTTATPRRRRSAARHGDRPMTSRTGRRNLGRCSARGRCASWRRRSASASTCRASTEAASLPPSSSPRRRLTHTHTHTHTQFNNHNRHSVETLRFEAGRVPRGSVTEWLACWTQAQKGLGSNRGRNAVA